MYSNRKPPYPPAGPPYENCHEPVYTHAGTPPCNTYPYIDPCKCDSYGHSCYHETNEFPFPKEFPVNGPFKGSGFVMNNYNPYLFDTTHVRYGKFLCLSESVLTRVSRRSDPSCIDLFATFDLTKGIYKNTIMNDYLCKSISQKSDELHGYFPLMQSNLLFRIYYKVYDEAGAVVHQNTMSVSTNDVVFHFTDVRDYFVESAKSIMMTNIPPMDYSGIYRLHIDKFEVYGNIINTYDHIEGDLNPYYAFTNNNDKIVLQHDVIAATEPDASILLATTPINQDIPFQANITTRLKLQFTAFLGELIAVPKTLPVYQAMFEPTQEKLDRLVDEVNSLKDEVALLNSTINQMKSAINEIRVTVADHDNKINKNTADIANLSANTNYKFDEIDGILNDHEVRITALEAIPFAIRRYRKDIEFKAGQLTYVTYGEVFQVTHDFTASGIITNEINNGYVTPLIIDGDVTLEAVMRRLSHVEDEVNEMDTKVDGALDTVSGYDEIIAGVQTTTQDCVERVGEVETTVQTFDERISRAEEIEFYINTEAFPIIGQPDKMYIDLSEGETYVWDDETGKYELIDQQLDDDSTIQSRI